MSLGRWATAGAAIFAPSIVRAAQKVTLGVVNTISDAPYFIADAKGYFKEAGLEVEITNLRGKLTDAQKDGEALQRELKALRRMDSVLGVLERNRPVASKAAIQRFWRSERGLRFMSVRPWGQRAAVSPVMGPVMGLEVSPVMRSMSWAAVSEAAWLSSRRWRASSS